MASRSENRAFLVDRFLGRLVAERPASVLDVGCGSGDLLRRVAEQGIEVAGLDAPGPRIDGLAADGIVAIAGRAERLPFEDDRFDWVTLRHVPHHLEDPARAVAEAARVARTGVLLAEPWYDRSIPSQEVGWQIDQWTRADDRRRGRLHGVGFGPAELAGLVAEADPRASIELETHLRPALEELDALRASLDERLTDLAAEDPTRTALAGLWAAALEHGAGLGGSAFAIARLG
ncbi:MAG: class I SAM-dependent methyltransferase [Planctomycetota bacterium]